jgi:hypothetical protein
MMGWRHAIAAWAMVATLVGATPARAERGPLVHPEGPGSGRLRVGVGAQLDVLPKRVVESEQRIFPQLFTHLRLGLPLGFSLSARVAAIVVKNDVELGAIWGKSFGRFSFALTDHVGFSYGILTVAGFDASSWSFSHKPGVVLGAAFGPHRLSAAFELLTTFGQRTRLGDAEVVSRRAFVVSGQSVLVTFETLLDHGGELLVSMGAFYTQPDYQAWIAFADERSRLLYPRFMVGYVF